MLCSTTTRGSADPRPHGCGGISTHGGLGRRPFQARAWHTLRAAGPSPGRCGAPAEARCSRPRSWLAGAPLRRHGRLQRLNASQELTAVSGLIPLSQDVMTFLASTVFVIPVFRRLKISPILGYLLSGLVLQKFGWVAFQAPFPPARRPRRCARCGAAPRERGSECRRGAGARARRGVTAPQCAC
jgi:hypothetical protein